MAAGAKPKKPKKKLPVVRGLAAYTEQGSVPVWLTLARTVLILALAATLPMVLGVEEGRRLFWAAMIAVLPVFWVLGGYHVWRRICPLAAISQLGRFVGIGGKRRISGKLAEHYLLLQLGLMIAALSLRLIMTNGTKWALIGFLVAAVALAIVTGLIFTGKTWCNYVCPVGMVEKFYTEPIRLAGPKDSKCKPCTACKKNCPDIDLEQHYWKELEMPARRTAYFAWPGIVFAFYFYYYLFRGDWAYYFSGLWTLENEQMTWWLEPGLFFLDVIPVVAAVPLTLIVFGLASYAVFRFVERLIRSFVAERGTREEQGETPAELARHRTLALAGFSAFIIFYWFGGQPTIRRLPGWFGEGFAVVVVIAACAVFFRRWARSQAEFVKERFAEKLLKRWKWGDAPESAKLADIYLVHSERTKERDRRLEAYKETVREMVADGLVTKSELVILDSLRAQLGVSDSDHDRILGELSDEERQLFDPAYQGSLEQRLQAEQYQRELARLVIAAAHAGHAPSEKALGALRDEFQVDKDDEDRAIADLIAPGGELSRLFGEQVDAIGQLASAHRAALAERTVEGAPSTSYQFFRDLCHRRARDRTNNALNLLTPMFDAVGELAEFDFVGASEAKLAHASGQLRDMIGDELAEPLLAAIGTLRDDSDPPSVPSAGPLLALVDDSSPALRAATVHLLSRFDDDDAVAAVTVAASDANVLVREAAVHALGARGRLNRELLSAALADDEQRVRQAARTTGLRASGSGQQAAPAGGQATSGVYATFDAAGRIETLTALDKMMLLHQVPLFANLDPHDLEELSELATERRFTAGDDVCEEGALEDDVFLIISGQLEAWKRTENGDRTVLGLSGAGSCIGEMAVLDSAPRSASVTAKTDARTLVLGGGDFKAMLATRPSVAGRIIEELTGRLRRMITGT